MNGGWDEQRKGKRTKAVSGVRGVCSEEMRERTEGGRKGGDEGDE